MQLQPTIGDRISAKIETLSPQLRRAARFVGEHPEEVATRSLRHIAGIIKIAPATFSRLAPALGFRNYEELRELCRNEISYQRAQFSARALILQESIAAESRNGQFIYRMGSASTDNIKTLLDSIDIQKLEAAASKLYSARRVILIGGMSSRPFVDYMAYMASMAFDNWSVFCSKAEPAGASLIDVDERDVAFIISKMPNSRISIETAKIFNERGVFVIGVTNDIISPLPPHCHLSFQLSTETPQFFLSHVTTLVLIESLIGIVVAKGGEKVSKRIAMVEAANHTMSEYLDN